MTLSSRTAPRRGRARYRRQDAQSLAPGAPKAQNAPTYRLTLQEARSRLLGPRTGPGHVLGLDQATATGWALVDLLSKRCILSGRSVGAEGERETIAHLSTVPGLDWSSVLVVFEDHSTIRIAGGDTTAATLLSLGESRQRWKTLLSDVGQPAEARMLASPEDWRKLLGTRVNVGRAAWKQQAKLWASALVRRRIESDDEAEAIVIAMWGAHEGLVRWASGRAEQGADMRRKSRRRGQQ